MLRLSGLCGCAAIAVASPGCLSIAIDAREFQPAVHVSGVQAQGEAQPLQTFEASTRATWLFWGLVVRSDPQVGTELSRVLAEAGGDGVRALTIVTQQTASHYVPTRYNRPTQSWDSLRHSLKSAW